MNNSLESLEETLNSFDLSERRRALDALARHCRSLSPQAPGTVGRVNMHCHSFYSYNAEGWSPARVAWEARKANLRAVALCDFDVLDGLEEFMEAGLVLGVRTAVHMETRVYAHEFESVEVNSPGEPGAIYFMAAGFGRLPAPDGACSMLSRCRLLARERNRRLVDCLNAALPQIAIDYERDVASLTPAGNATERHIARAYVDRAVAVLGHAESVARFWADTLQVPIEEAAALLADRDALEKNARARFLKKGGLAYREATPMEFPAIEEFAEWARRCLAIPMAAWLDGASAGERDAHALLERMKALGAAAVNIIPDRNWNVSESTQRAVRVKNLHAFMKAAADFQLPVNAGSEMNAPGQPFADDLDCAALRPYKETFLRGADIMVGQTLLARYAGFSYLGAAAESEFRDTSDKNAFFEKVGRLAPLSVEQARRLAEMGDDRALAWFHDAIRRLEVGSRPRAG